MTDTSDPMQAFTELADQIKRAAYAAGYRDGLAAAAKAVTELVPSDAPETIGPPSPKSSNGTSVNTAKAALTVGSTPYYIVSVLQKKPEGMTPAEIIQALQEMGHKAPENSIRTNIHRLKERRIIVARHGKWLVKTQTATA